MKEKFEALKTWATNNKLTAAVIAFVVIAILAKFGAKYMRRPARRRRLKTIKSVASSRRRSVNTIIKSGPNKGKKAWQIKGSEAARRHMANIRRKRGK